MQNIPLAEMLAATPAPSLYHASSLKRWNFHYTFSQPKRDNV